MEAAVLGVHACRRPVGVRQERVGAGTEQHLDHFLVRAAVVLRVHVRARVDQDP
ncbi:hypothetical protein ACF09J_24120 [Streptomyces sp. NPDC014889]|uniref:hypothetical protein n=1 Tax=Streptomyces sp. NPDC014889 TaxID=3364928 RepID=UPI0036FA22A9